MRTIFVLAVVLCSFVFPRWGALIASETSGNQTQEFRGWFQGTVEEAFVSAKTSQKPIFLYWGAKWCPPCHELRSQVFNKQSFKEIMSLVVPVYLDGDTESAQIWSDKLKVSGYPSVLLLSPEGREMFRFIESVNFSEFEDMFRAALQNLRPLSELVSAAEKNSGNDSIWRVLAHINWSDVGTSEINPDDVIPILTKLYPKIPARMDQQRALFAMHILNSALEIDEKKSSSVLQKRKADVRKDSHKYLKAIFATQDSKLAARNFILHSAGAMVGFLKPSKSELRVLEQKWLLAAKSVRSNTNISLDTHLWSYYPAVEFAQMKFKSHEKVVFPSHLVAEIKRQAAHVNTKAQGKNVRHAVVSSVASILQKIGEVDEARRLLEQEEKVSDTPWYYQSGLALLERDIGNVAKALEWSAASVVSAQGQSTKLQWMASDVQMRLKFFAKMDSAGFREDLMSRLSNYYQTAFSLRDGFVGRNAGRQKKLAEQASNWIQKVPQYRNQFANWQKKCADLQNSCATGKDTEAQPSNNNMCRNADNCETHFAAIFTETKQDDSATMTK